MSEIKNEDPLELESPLLLAVSLIDDTAKGGLTQFWELFTAIPCALKHLKRLD